MSQRRLTEELMMKVAKKHKTRKSLREADISVYAAAGRKTIVVDGKTISFRDHICSHMVPHTKWTDEALMKAAKGYKNRGQFQVHNAKAYMAAYRAEKLDFLSEKLGW